MNTKFYTTLLTFSRPLCVFLIVCILWGGTYKGGYILDGGEYILGRDFLNMWHYGKSAFFENAGLFYDQTLYNLELDKLIPDHNYKNQQFSYPPHFMLLSAPFGLIPYSLALSCFTLLGLGLFWKVALKPFDKTAHKVLLTAPALALSLLCGQLSLLIAVAFILIMKTMDERPWVAALLIACLTVKPQIGFLFPIYLLATGRYKLFIYTAIACFGFIGASLAIHGVDVWHIYLTSASGDQASRMVDSYPGVLGLMPTLYVNFAMLGIPVKIAQILHAVAAITAILFMVKAVRTTQNKELGYIAFIATSFAVTPYLMAYDTILLVWAAMFFGTMTNYNRLDKTAIFLLLGLPVIGVVMSMSGFTGYALIIWLTLFCILKHILETTQNSYKLAKT